MLPERPHYTVVATAVSEDAWLLAVKELADSWTVAFSVEELERRARARIALDTKAEPDEFEVEIIRVHAPVSTSSRLGEDSADGES